MQVSAKLREALFDALEAAGQTGVRLDVRQVPSIDKSRVALLVGANHRAAALGRTLVRTDHNGPVTRRCLSCVSSAASTSLRSCPPVTLPWNLPPAPSRRLGRKSEQRCRRSPSHCPSTSSESSSRWNERFPGRHQARVEIAPSRPARTVHALGLPRHPRAPSGRPCCRSALRAESRWSVSCGS